MLIWNHTNIKMVYWFLWNSDSPFRKKTQISLNDSDNLHCPISTQLCQFYCHSLAFLISAKMTLHNEYFIWPDKLVAFVLKIQVFWDVTLLWLLNSPAVKENGFLDPEKEGATFFLYVDSYLPVDKAELLISLESSSVSQWQPESSQYSIYGTPYPCRTF